MKETKAKQADHVTFRLDEEEKVWYITHPNGGIVTYFSVNNGWVLVTDLAKSTLARSFASLHAAINYAKRRGFKLYNVPVYTCDITDDILTVFLNGKVVEHYPMVKSEKQVSDIMKRDYAVHLNKTESII